MEYKSSLPNATSAPVCQETYLVASTGVFRKYAKLLPNKDDIVLEIGASYGDATEVLARSAKQVFAVEHSKEAFDALTRTFAGQDHVRPLWHDARDIHGTLALCPHADILFFDVGGDAPVHVAIYLLQLYMLAYRPRIAVIRNIALAGLFGHVQLTEFPDKKGYERYKVLPTRQEILAHYERESSRSAKKFVERSFKKQNEPLLVSADYSNL